MYSFFSVVITEHRLWGHIFQPYILQKTNAVYYTIQELVTLKNRISYNLSETENKIVSLCEKYSESNILKMFCKEKISMSEFQKKYKRNPKEYEFILPFIDKYNYSVAEKLMNSEIPVFYKKGGYMNLYSTDAITVSSDYANHIVSFERTDNFLYYALRIFQDEKNIPLKNKIPIILCNSPGCILINNRIFLFQTLEASRLTPFFQKESITISKKAEPVYMKSFVLNTLKEEQVETKGFDVKEEQFDPIPILTIMEDLQKIVALKLSFRYGKKEFSTEISGKKQVSLREEKNNFIFDVFIRNEEKEFHYKQIIESLGFKQYNLFFYPLKDTFDLDSGIYQIIEIIRIHKDVLNDFEIRQEYGEKYYSLDKINLSTNVDTEKDWFDIYGNVQVGTFSIPFVKFRKHILSGTREYMLPDNTIVVLPEEWFSRFSEIFRFSEEQNGKVRLKKIYFGILDSFIQKSENETLRKYKADREIPEGVSVNLRTYQQEGYSWLLCLYENNFGGCLADDMGLGKTLQFLTFFQYIYKGLKNTHSVPSSVKYNWSYEVEQPTLFDQIQEDVSEFQKISEEKKKPASLIVLPTSLVHNWKNEKNKFTPGLITLLYSGNKRIRTKNIGKIFDHYDLVLTTYGVIRNDIEFLSQYEFECIVLDESQYIKNPSSQIYQSVSELRARNYFVITGTPIENSLNDLWAQLNFVNKGMLGSLSYFKNHFVNPILKQQNEEREKKLQQIIKPFILRRTKDEVAKDLPPIIEQAVYCTMSEEQNKIYLSEKSVVRNHLFSQIFQSGLEKNTMLAISALLRLRQLANHPALVLDNYSGESAKIEEVISRIESLQAENHKVLIFSSFVKLLELIEKRLKELNIQYVLLTGETKNREDVIYKFQDNPDIGCFLISLKAGGVGLNLTAADYVFILDPWWNPAAEMQAVNRAHRIGQNKTVMVYRFITQDTIEEKIQNLQIEKSKLAETYINNNNPFPAMEVSDIEKLFD